MLKKSPDTATAGGEWVPLIRPSRSIPPVQLFLEDVTHLLRLLPLEERVSHVAKMEIVSFHPEAYFPQCGVEMIPSGSRSVHPVENND